MCLRHLRRVSADDATTFGWVNSISAFLHILMSAMTSAQPKIILARSAKACAVFGRRTHRSKVSRSTSSKISGGIGRPIAMVILLWAANPEDNLIANTITMNFSYTTLVSCIRSSSHYCEAFLKDSKTDSCLKQSDRPA